MTSSPIKVKQGKPRGIKLIKIKERTNKFLPVNIYYWRDNVGNEFDCIQEGENYLNVIEIKSGLL